MHSGRIRVQYNNMQFQAAVTIQFHEKYNFIETVNTYNTLIHSSAVHAGASGRAETQSAYKYM